MAKFLDFKDISRQVAFETLLNHLNIPITKETGKEMKGECSFKFIINKEKNIFFSPGNDTIKGSVINFYSEYKGINLRESAQYLQDTFITSQEPQKKREIPNLELHFCKELEDRGFSAEFCEDKKVGLVKQKSILSGKIAFHISEKKGYIAYDTKKENWFFPKGFRRDVLYDPNRIETDYCILTTSTFDTLHLINIGFPFTVGLMAKSATDQQLEILKKFKRILIIHPEPEAITLRLSPYCFCKAVRRNSARELAVETVRSYF